MNASDDVLGTLLSVPPPVLAEPTLLAHLAAGWGLAGELVPLTSERDLNHRLDTADGRFLAKITNPAEAAEMTDFQTRAFLHVAAVAPGVPVPRLIPARTGAPWRDTPAGRLRLFTWLAGDPLHAVPRSLALARASGVALAQLTAALAGFSHPADDHVILWDIRQFSRLAPLLPVLSDPGTRDAAEAALARFATAVAPRLADLPSQVCHADFNPWNLLVDADRQRIAGIVDFGDMVRTPRICDLAVAASYQIDPAAPLASLAAFVAGYHGVLPLLPEETELLFDLIVARMITTLVIAGWRAARYPENADYILRNTPSARAGLAAFRALGPMAVTRCLAEGAEG
ncbi:MAG: phosphotransferase [Rhodobacteraceae bacterium]|jgi:hydroxylysine kinase|nr:phosphotransferase [Paracoccaceae bacterium]